MKTGSLLLICCAVLATARANAQSTETIISYDAAAADGDHNTIAYSGRPKLSVSDFKGTPDNGNTAVAITNSGFMFKAGFRRSNGQSTMQVKVYAAFDKRLSWMKEKGKNDYILLHEQHHFDISYIGARWFIKKVKKLSFTQDNYQDRLKKAYEDAVKAMEALQEEYDSETNNGIDTGKQESWNKKIDQLLASLDESD